ncbi:MAG: hypothetical protein ACXWBO_00920 [Ilumatobacteraceae bacterium]
MSELQPDVIAAIQAMQSPEDYHAADDRVKEALRTWLESDPDVINEVGAVLDDPPIDE